MNPLSSVIRFSKSSNLYEGVTEMSNPLDNLTKVSDWTSQTSCYFQYLPLFAVVLNTEDSILALQKGVLKIQPAHKY